jgi:putative transposase
MLHTLASPPKSNEIILLARDQMKTIVADSLQWLVQNKRCTVNAFVIMPNHIHLIFADVGVPANIKRNHSFAFFNTLY